MKNKISKQSVRPSASSSGQNIKKNSKNVQEPLSNNTNDMNISISSNSHSTSTRRVSGDLSIKNQSISSNLAQNNSIESTSVSTNSSTKNNSSNSSSNSDSALSSNTSNNHSSNTQNSTKTNKKSKKSSHSTVISINENSNTGSNSSEKNVNSNASSSSRHSNSKNNAHSSGKNNNNQQDKLGKSNPRSFRNIIFSITISFFVAVAFVSSNPKLLSSIQKRTLNSDYNNQNNNARYIRSVNNQQNSMGSLNQNSGIMNNQNMINSNQESNDNHKTLITKLTNGVTEMYNQHLSPSALQSSISSLLGQSSDNSNNMKQADLSNLSKNGKLHYIPSSAFDPTKTAHHVLEGAGYRLNIPSYVQSVPSNGNEQKDHQKQELNQQNENLQQINSNAIKNEEFDYAISQKQVIRPRTSAFNTMAASMNINSGNTVNTKANIVNPNEVPLSTVDPVLDSLIKEMLEKRSQSMQNKASSNLVGGQLGSNSVYPNGVQPGALSSMSSSQNFNLIKKMNTTEIFNKNSDEGVCQPTKDIVFAKTHKTGGTTITNMLLRHAEKQKLNVALPVEYHWELAGYPAPYNADLITPKQDNYNVMCHHMRFNKTEIEKQVNPLADYFTILRDPVSNFESSFGFFKDYPFTNWLDNSRSIDDFVNNADTYYNKSTPWYFRAKNYMSFDLGFDHENNSEAYIRHAIAKMEEDFKFVMITDRYEESMILLKNMLCLDYDDIVYLPLKVRTDNDRKKISADTAAKIKQWNRLDTAIYEYFSQRFEQMTLEYGKDKLAREVEILKEKLKDVEARCVEDYDSQSLKPWIKRIKLRKPSGQKCQRLVWGEVKYADYLRQSQYSTLSEEEYNSQPKLDDKIQLMQQVQKQVLGETTI